MIIEAFLDFHPPTATAQHKGVRTWRKKAADGKVKTHVQFFKKSDLVRAEAMLRIQLEKHVPLAPMVGPLKLTATWTFDWFKYEMPARRAGELPQWIPSTGWPDCSNIIKLFEDVMTSLHFWKDDSHVASLWVRKGRGDRPGIHLRIEPYVTDYVPPEGDVEPEIDL